MPRDAMSKDTPTTARARRKDHRAAPPRRQRGGLITALDVGTTKIACFIAREEEDGALRVLGVGHHRSRGMRNGQVANMDEVELSVRAAVDAAEQMANERISTVVVNVSGGQPHSTRVEVEMSIAGHEVRGNDVRRIQAYGRGLHTSADRELVHCIPVSYAIDGTEGVLDPRGMFGQSLGVSIHLVSAAAGPLRNLSTVVERCHLDIEDKVVSPYASGLACLVEDEKQMGVTVIDLGGGTTSIAVFHEGHVVHTEMIPVGGLHVTNDIAKGLTTPVANAERLKTIHGSCSVSPADTREILRVPLVGEDDEATANEVPRSMLVQIIRPRIEETFELVRGRLEASGFDKVGGRLVVLTGGGSQLQGVRELAEVILDRQVRPGRPQRIRGLADSTSGPAFATCAGMLRYAVQHQVETPDTDPTADEAVATGALGRFARWWKDNF
ncbi:cell division protein FtsA [Rhodospirillum rubrum]|uniref:cell division protein FtsA n=1 Tax=Rhodospirillum rubrum TaxID=1085 RepID=UPI001906B835|nr:cell division protein FtsA [Rhodospirillum rubrum]MBK1663980.1 cell division protein FtsA [Rhodospirillum rubrum]MBK1677526.1 cell division protein FtsA [Rhodospirillum rubrum]